MSRFLTTNRNIELLEPYEGNSHVRFLGEKGAAMPPPYPIFRSRVISLWSRLLSCWPLLFGFENLRGWQVLHLPHAIEFLNRNYEDIFPILTSYRELENYLSPFMDAWKAGAGPAPGQIASAKIPLSRMISYTALLGNDRQRLHPRHQQPRSIRRYCVSETILTVRTSTVRPRSIQFPYCQAHQQEKYAQIGW